MDYYNDGGDLGESQRSRMITFKGVKMRSGIKLGVGHKSKLLIFS